MDCRVKLDVGSTEMAWINRYSSPVCLRHLGTYKRPGSGNDTLGGSSRICEVSIDTPGDSLYVSPVVLHYKPCRFKAMISAWTMHPWMAKGSRSPGSGFKNSYQ